MLDKAERRLVDYKAICGYVVKIGEALEHEF